jgi:hypothetical protein
MMKVPHLNILQWVTAVRGISIIFVIGLGYTLAYTLQRQNTKKRNKYS